MKTLTFRIIPIALVLGIGLIMAFWIFAPKPDITLPSFHNDAQPAIIDLTGNEAMDAPVPRSFHKTIDDQYWLTGFSNGTQCWWHLHQQGRPVPAIDESPFDCTDMETFLQQVFRRLGFTYGPYAKALEEFITSFKNFTPPPAMP